MRSYTQLTQGERYQIYALKQAGHRQGEIAQVLGRHKATISRELRRNRGLRGYRPKQAHRRAQARRVEKARPRLRASLWRRVEALILRDWSPEQISGRLALEAGVRVSHERIYQHIYADRRAGGDLHRHLRCQKRRRKRYGSRDRRGRIPNPVSIDERPAIVESRGRLGDWEGDTVIGRRHRGALLTLVERRSRYTVIEALGRKTAQAVREAIVARLRPYRDRVHTLTTDHGREFADHKSISTDLGTEHYFAHPYASWERGTSENTNGLIRQYFPKDRDLTHISEMETDETMRRLNHRPRKVLAFRTPYEVFFKTRTALTVALGS